MEFIQEQLTRIEQLLINEQVQNKEILSLKEVSIYLGQSKSSIYKLTSKREIPFYVPNGKMIYFKKQELDDWVFNGKVESSDEIEEDIEKYLSQTLKK